MKEILINNNYIILKTENKEYKETLENFVNKIVHQLVNSKSFDEYKTFFFFIVKKEKAVELIKEEFKDSNEIKNIDKIIEFLLPKIKRKFIEIIKENNDYRYFVLKYRIKL